MHFTSRITLINVLVYAITEVILSTQDVYKGTRTAVVMYMGGGYT